MTPGEGEIGQFEAVALHRNMALNNLNFVNCTEQTWTSHPTEDASNKDFIPLYAKVSRSIVSLLHPEEAGICSKAK